MTCWKFYKFCIFELSWSVSSITHRRFSEPIIIAPICRNRNMYVVNLIRRRICLPIYLKVFCFTKVVLTETTWEKTYTFIALFMLIIWLEIEAIQIKKDSISWEASTWINFLSIMHYGPDRRCGSGGPFHQRFVALFSIKTKN